jgi:hypothetical protein
LLRSSLVMPKTVPVSSKPSGVGAAGAGAGAAWLAAQAKKTAVAKPVPKKTTTHKQQPLSSKPGPNAKPLGKPATPGQGATKQVSALDQTDKRLNDYEKQYKQKAEGKAGVQKAMDWFRKGFNAGYGDDQFKNIGESKRELASIQSDLKSNKLTQAQAEQKSAALLKRFGTEEARVTKAQGENAKVGKVVQETGRVVVVAGVGVTTTVATGNPLIGFAAASGAGSIYDAVGKSTEGSNKQIAPRVDASNSLGGVAASAFKGEKINGGDIARATLGTVMDGTNGAFAGQGALSARAAQAALKAGGTQVSRLTLAGAVARTNTVNTLQHTAAVTTLKTAGIYGDGSLTGQQQNQLAKDNLTQTLKGLPTQLAAGMASSYLGMGGQIKSNKVLDAAVQYGGATVINAAQTSVNNKLVGKGFRLSNADIAAIGVQGAGSVIQNVAQRQPSQSSISSRQRDITAKDFQNRKATPDQMRRALVVAAKDARTANQPTKDALTLAMKMRAFGNSTKAIANDRLYDNYLNTIHKQPIGELIKANNHVIVQAGGTLTETNAKYRSLSANDLGRVPRQLLPQMDSSNPGNAHETHTVFGSVSKLGEVHAHTNAFNGVTNTTSWHNRGLLPNNRGTVVSQHWQVDQPLNWYRADRSLTAIENASPGVGAGKLISNEVKALTGDGFLPKGTPLATRMQRLEKAALRWDGAQSQLARASAGQAQGLIQSMQSAHQTVQSGIAVAASSPKQNRLDMLTESFGTPQTTYALTVRHAAAARYMKSIEGKRDAVFDANKFRGILKEVKTEAKRAGLTGELMHWHMLNTYATDRGFQDAIKASSPQMQDAWRTYRQSHGVYEQ